MNRYGVRLLALPWLLLSCGEGSRGPIDPYMRVEWPAPLERFHSVLYVEVPDHPASLITGLTHRAFVDMNGDGLLDLIATVDPEPANPGIRRVSTLHVALNEGGRMGPLGEWKLPTGAHVDGIQGEILPCEGMLSWRIADLDSDGRPDFIVTGIGSGEEPSCETRPFGDFDDDAGFHWLLYRNLGDRFAEEGQVFRVPGWQRELTTRSADHADYDLRDMDGDGLLDLVITWSHARKSFSASVPMSTGSFSTTTAHRSGGAPSGRCRQEGWHV